MQIRVLLTVLMGVTFTAALTPADCDCFTVCDGDLHDADNCYNSNIGCGTFDAPTCCVKGIIRL
ncbi:uncharacterized protein TRIVIDRAFT_222876 [Trichoderma virens Gv29-8]|uniref:Hydrophobin n=1 Tax=Hypocrea virens (strain Gv29-8 / FGSC 10586) TaxID=413071 RepID=G9MVB9_HYPVG|nr:uncharacterized protein TRIVIDRAFT_222876 [Trichoderma virens Gv29-8]EHK21635.1 hypothetical protein TRIVIDRAFT_222876 [Trichoderma virens Gv29-8]